MLDFGLEDLRVEEEPCRVEVGILLTLALDESLFADVFDQAVSMLVLEHYLVVA
jgi:hypothetical protein